MADDQTQRPYRLNEPPVRRPTATTSPTGSDPLAELARLIGQTDPFGEFGRDNTRRAAVPPPPVAAPPTAPKFGANDYFGAAPPPPLPPLPETGTYGAKNVARLPLAEDENFYHEQPETPEHVAVDADSFEPDAYPQSNAQLAGNEADVYEDAQPPKRRSPIMTVAAVFALAVIGTASALGYRAVFGPTRSSAPPPVIKADTAPSKIVPAASSKAPTKLITDRVPDRAEGEKIVSREEKPVEIKGNPPPAPQASAPPQPQAGPPPVAAPVPPSTGVVASEPKKVHTIAIRPDQASAGDGQPMAPPAAAPAPAKPASPQVASTAEPTSPPLPAPRRAETRPAAPAHQAQASAPRNAPLSLSPDTPAAAAARAPVRTASAASTATEAHAAGTYAVQVASQRSEADAQATYRGLQGKFPSQLGGREASIRKVELGAKGTYYRAMVGPFANASEASTLCSSLKAAGGQCIVQRN